MPAVLTHKAIMMLTRDRLHEVRRRLKVVRDRKIMFGTPRSALEDKVFKLADLAVQAMEDPSGADATIRTFSGAPEAVGTNPISRFAVMGAMGPDITGFSEVFNPGQAWVFDTIHKGTPDYNRELVNAGTTDMALRLYRRAADLAAAQITDGTARQAHLGQVRAYVMGHLTHLAADIVSHPFINDLEWHEGTEAAPHREHGDNEKAIDVAVAQTLFGKGGIRSGVDDGWQRWWPADDALHSSFYDAYAAAFTDTYGPAPRDSFADWDSYLESLGAPDVDGGFIRHGYRTMRGFGIGVGYDWPIGNWYAVLSAIFVPLMGLPWVSYGMKNARTFYDLPPGDDNPAGERAAFELITAPIGMTSLGALMSGAMMLPFTARGSGGRAVTGVVMQSLALAGFLTTAIEGAAVDEPDDGIPHWARWIFLLAPQLLSGGLYTGFTFADLAAEPDPPRPFTDPPPEERRVLMNAINALPFLILVIWGLFFLLPLFIRKTTSNDAESPIKFGSAGFIGTTVVWMLLMLGLWIGLPFWLRSNQVPDTNDANDPALRPHALRMFDDTTIWTDPEQSDARLAQVYPSDYRPLARLWWTGAGKMDIRVDRLSLTFRPKNGDEQVIPTPMAPLTPAQFVQLLMDTVVDKDGATGGLQGEVYDTGDAGAVYPIPSGVSFAAHGDHDHNADTIAEGLAEFERLTAKNNKKTYRLFHATKPHQAVFMGTSGTFRAADADALDIREAADGFSYVTDPALDGPRPDKLMSRAAEVAALFCMGAAGHVAPGVTDSDKVYQVFRNWSLDRRRVNEWKMLIAGQALSDKGGAPEAYDTAMPGGDLAPAAGWTAPVNADAPSVIAEAEATALELGWINVMEDWLAALEAGQDMTAASTGDPSERPPRALSRAMAFIFDAPDPAEGAV